MQKHDNEILVKINDITVSYAENPKLGVPTVIFIHGFPFNKTMWNAQTDALKGKFHVVTYDIRGHGHSEEGIENFSIDLFVSDLMGLMDHLKIDEAVLCGLSLGGYIALNAISKFPNRIKALVLSDTQCIADTEETIGKRMKSIESIKNGGLEKYADESVRNLFAPGSFISRCREIADIRQMILTTSGHRSVKPCLLSRRGKKHAASSAILRFLCSLWLGMKIRSLLLPLLNISAKTSMAPQFRQLKMPGI